MATSNEQSDLLASADVTETKESVATSESSSATASASSSTTDSSSASSTSASDAPKKPVSKKFHQEEVKAPSGNKYLMTFPGVQKAMRLQSENNANHVTLHTMFMNNILEGKYSYATFDAIDDGVDRSKDVTVHDDDGTEHTYHIKFQSFKQLDEVQDQAFNNGIPDPYPLSVYTFDNLLEEDVSFDYFDEHNGLSEILDAVYDLYTDLQANSEFGFVMNKVSDFLNSMFR